MATCRFHRHEAIKIQQRRHLAAKYILLGMFWKNKKY